MLNLSVKSKGINGGALAFPVTAAFILISIFPLILGAELTKEYAPTILSMFIFLGATIFAYTRNSVQFFSPNSLVFFYCSLSLALGSMGMRDGLSLVPRTISEYERHAYTHVALSFVMLGLAFLPLVQVRLANRIQLSRSGVRIRMARLIPISLIVAPIAFVGLDLSAIGGSGNLSVYAQSLLSVALILIFGRYSAVVRYAVFLGILIVMVVLHPHDKRVAIFLAFPFLFLEARSGALNLSLGSIVVFSALIALLIYLLLAMSIARGYGGFDVDGSVLLAFLLVGEYFSSEFFWAALLQNIEVSYFYFHYVNAIELIASGVASPTLGETLIKFFFLPFPREIIGWKPDSIIDLYTLTYDPSFRSIGGSWPPNFAAEYFWNFHLFGIILFPVFAWLNARLFNYLLSPKASKQPYLFILGLFAYMNILTYARGSGLDLFSFFLVTAGLMLLLSALLHQALVASCR